MLQYFSALTHPNIDPVLISLGPVQIHWYGAAYVAGILFGWWYARKLCATPALWHKSSPPIRPEQVDDFLIWAVIGIIAGGRIGYVLFYDLPNYLQNPLSAVAIWQGGMSFHGGLIGIIAAMILFARKHGFSPFSLFDIIAASAGPGIFLGRTANFINAELYGKPSDLPWAVVFPGTDGVPRHPSQLYEGLLEGALVFIILAILIWGMKALARPGLVGGAFLLIYALGRIAVEFVRLPDPQIGYLAGGWLTMGMILSVPVALGGCWVMATSRRRQKK